MGASLTVHVLALAAGVGLLAGWTWVPVGALAGVALALYDAFDERRRERELQRELAG